jgi:hypothetical protein
LELSSKTYDAMGDIAALGSGVLAWMYTSTAKYTATAQPYTIQRRFEDALASTFGRDVVIALDPSWAGWNGSADLHPNYWGWINKTTGTGIGLGLADYVLGDLLDIKAYSKDMDGLRKVVKGLAKGLTVGGVIGGVFDPQPKTANGTPQPLSAGTPEVQNYASAVVRHNMMAVAQGGV